MQGARELRCAKDHTHGALDTRNKRCRDCGGGLEKHCPLCEAFVSYSNAAKHAKRCGDAIAQADEAPPLRVAYLAAVWRDGLPLGQYVSHQLADGFPASLERRTLNETGGDEQSIDAYDAIWGTLFATDTRFELVHTYHSLDDVMNAMDGDALATVDVLVLGNWIHPLCERGKGAVERFLARLRDLEVDQQLRVFPPLDYAWTLAQKVHYYVPLQRFPLPRGAFAIPTMAVSRQFRWKQPILEFAERHKAERLIFKRELSEVSKHVLPCAVDALPALPGRSEQDGFRWMVQPVLKEFARYREMRMFVINGRCQWGVATRFVDVDTMNLESLAPGRASWNQDGHEAARMAEAVVAALQHHLPHVSHFLRVDMVRRTDGGWWINELEFFGNAFIHFDAFDNAAEMLAEIVSCIKKWLLSTVSF